MSRWIMWESRHPPLPCQEAELSRLFGDEVEVKCFQFGNAEAVNREFRQWRRNGGCLDLVAVVPLSTLDRLCRQGLTPLWADMAEEPPADGRKPDLEFQGRRFWFLGFRRVRGVTLELAPVQAEPRQRILRLTRHPAREEETAALRRLFGDEVEVIENESTLRNAQDVLDLYKTSEADDLLLVAPYGIIEQVVQGGLKPLWADVRGRRFHSLHRVQGVRIDFEPV